MLNSFDTLQQEILRFLLRAKDGHTIDEILEKVPTSRTTIIMLLGTLERDGYLVRSLPTAAGAPPDHVYRLSARGLDLFPKQYSWFSALLLEAFDGRLSGKELIQVLDKLAGKIAAEYQPKLQDMDPTTRMEAIVTIMNGLSFDAELAKKRGSLEPVIQASNCMYHHLAANHPEVCAFDRALLAELSGTKLQQTECMAKGGVVCSFQFRFGSKKHV